MAEILGTTLSDLAGRHSFDYVFPEDRDAAQRLFQAKQNGNIEPFRFRLRRADGSSIRVEVQGTPGEDSQGNFRIIGTFTVI